MSASLSLRSFRPALFVALAILASVQAFATDSDTVDLRDKKGPLIPVIPPMPRKSACAAPRHAGPTYAGDWLPKEPKVRTPTAVAAVRG